MRATQNEGCCYLDLGWYWFERDNHVLTNLARIKSTREWKRKGVKGKNLATNMATNFKLV